MSMGIKSFRPRHFVVVLTIGVVLSFIELAFLRLYVPSWLSRSGFPSAYSWKDGPRQTDLTPSLESDVSGYDVEEVSRWYKGSACSGRAGEFVGDVPLFPPCRQRMYPGVATWGKYPYLGPFEYMNNSKNPCWEREGEVMCLPYFYFIGVSKSGTTDLFYRLIRHPEIVWQQKEFHFFNRRRYNKVLTFENYIGLFNKLADAVKVDIRMQGYSHLITGDASPDYFYDNYYWQRYSGNENCSEPRVILANHIYHLNPAVKIIMIIRHPVYRLYSRYMFDFGRKERRHLPTRQEFHSFVVDGLRKFRECFQRWSLRHCVYNKTLMEPAPYIHIQESIYPVLLEDWLRVVPRNQFLFIRFDDYKKDSATQFRRVFSFLGIKNLSDKELATITDSEIKNEGTHAKESGPMLPETERLLQNFYQPFIRRFAAMLNDQKFLWEDM